MTPHDAAAEFITAACEHRTKDAADILRGFLMDRLTAARRRPTGRALLDRPFPDRFLWQQ